MPGAVGRALVALAALVALGPAPSSGQLVLPPPIAFEVGPEPVPFRSRGRHQLAYEVYLTNFGRAARTLNSVEVRTDDDAEAVAIIAGEELKALVGRPGIDRKSEDPRTFRPTTRGVVFFWVTLPEGSDLPRTLRHRFAFTANLEGRPPLPQVVEGPAVRVAATRAPRLGPPLKGDGWVARALSPTSYQRQGLLILDGRPTLGQRFAVDWNRYGPDGAAARGEGRRNSDYAAFGGEVIAVSDAGVALAVDGRPQIDPADDPPGGAALDNRQVFGNFVILDLGGGVFALYAHLQPGLKVETGQRVERGQLLGRVGRSGDASGPHLHFHLWRGPASDGSFPTPGEGLPFEIEEFAVLGEETPEEAEAGRWSPPREGRAEIRRREMPGQGEVLRFAG
jgi:murein DD-endopeptidase MepM/ murein hydrolase activator NlpD